MGLNESEEVFRLGETQCWRGVPGLETRAQPMSAHGPSGDPETGPPWVLYLLEDLVRANDVVCVRAQAGQGSG